MLSKDKKVKPLSTWGSWFTRKFTCYEDSGYEAWDVQEIVIQCIHETQEHRPRGGCGKPKPF